MSASPFHNSRRFAGKRLHLGVCGSIACYKALDLLRALHALDIHVSVTLTDGARRFVTPLLFEALGAMPVYGRMFEGDEVFDHLEPGQRAQAMLVAPASADALSRLAAGAASDMLSAQALAFDGPLVVAPAMNPRMWRHPATQDNVATLRRRGARVVVPGCGGTACGDTGQGRLAPVEDLFLAALRALSPQDMAGQRVMLTMGPTREKWDGVRYWTNPSSGTMGAALATSAWLRGAEVTAVCGPGCPDLPAGVERIGVGSAREMFEAASDCWPRMDMGLFCAAVADFSPEPLGPQKFKKEGRQDGFSIRFTANPDILRTLSHQRREGQKVLGFAAETTPDMDSLLELARGKRARKDADLLAGNRVNSGDSGFGAATNSMAVVDRTGMKRSGPTRARPTWPGIFVRGFCACKPAGGPLAGTRPRLAAHARGSAPGALPVRHAGRRPGRARAPSAACGPAGAPSRASFAFPAAAGRPGQCVRRTGTGREAGRCPRGFSRSRSARPGTAASGPSASRGTGPGDRRTGQELAAPAAPRLARRLAGAPFAHPAGTSGLDLLEPRPGPLRSAGPGQGAAQRLFPPSHAGSGLSGGYQHLLARLSARS